MSTTNAATQRERRMDRRVAVHLPIEIRGTDDAGNPFLETTQSVNVSRRGVAFMLNRNIDRGANIEIRIPMPRATAGKDAEEFSTVGRVVHVKNIEGAIDLLIGVEFTGRSFQRIFVSESAKD
jgi:c-di-GMP-binding flagellar brake protein YcgR